MPLLKKKSNPKLGAGVAQHVSRSVPGVDGRSEGECLFAIGCMTDEIVGFSVGSSGSDVQLIDGVSDTISRVGGTVTVAGVRRIRHQDANKADGDELIRQMNGLTPPLPESI